MLTVAFSMIIAIVPSLLIMNLSGAMFKKSIIHNNQIISEQTAKQVEQYLLNAFNELEIISDTVFSSVRDQWVAEVLLNNAAIRSANFNKFYLSGYEEGTENTRVINTGNSEIFMSEIWFSKDNVPYIKISRKIYGLGRSMYINGILDFHTIWKLIDSIQVGETGNAIVLTESFKTIASPKKGEIFLQDQLMEIAARETDPTFTTRLYDNSGKIYYLSLSSIPVTGWYGGIQQSAAEALKPLVRTTGQSVAIIAVIIVLFLFLFFLKLKQYVRPKTAIPDTMIRSQDESLLPISKTINDVSLRLKTGPMRFITIADTVDVPIIITSKELFIEFTNLMFQECLELHSSEIIGSPIQYFLTPGSSIRLKNRIKNMKEGVHEIPDIKLEFVSGRSKTSISKFIIKKSSIGGSEEWFFFGKPSEADSAHSQIVSDDIMALCGYFSEQEENLRSNIVYSLIETVEKPLRQVRSKLTQQESTNIHQLDTITSRFRHKMRKVDSPVYRGASLKSALSGLIGYLKINTAFEYIFIYNLGDKIIEKKTALILYRCTAELLMLSIEYSNASRFKIEIDSMDGNTILKFEDDSTGTSILKKGDLNFIINKIKSCGGTIAEQKSLTSANVLQISIPAEKQEETDHEDQSPE